MAFEYIYQAAIQEIMLDRTWLADGLARMEVSLDGETWHARNPAERRQPIPIREILALREAQEAATTARQNQTIGILPLAAGPVGRAHKPQP